MIMRTQISKSIFLLLLVAGTSHAQHGDWIKVAPLGAGFAILMPTRPVESVEPKQDYTSHVFSAVAGNTIFILCYVDYAASMKIDEPGELAANRDNFIKGVNARLISSKEISFDGHAGLEFAAEDDHRTFKSRVYILGNRVHQVASASLKSEDDSENVNRFFNSFTFTKN